MKVLKLAMYAFEEHRRGCSNLRQCVRKADKITIPAVALAGTDLKGRLTVT